MASVHPNQKRPSFSNWFSSLRRQPKNKKSATSASTQSLYHGGGDHKQRSCIDLSVAASAAAAAANANSTFYTPAQKPYSGSGSTTVASSVDNLLEDDDRRGLVATTTPNGGSRVAKLCSRCCCTFVASAPPPPASRSHTPPAVSLATGEASMPTSPTNSAASSWSTPRHSPLPPQPISLSAQTTVETNVSNKVDFARLPTAEPDTMILTKRTELLRQMTTTTTRTLIISRPVELVLNERGEVIGRRTPPVALADLATPATPISPSAKFRSTSLDCVLDGRGSNGEDTDSCHSESPTPPSPRAAELLQDDALEFRFIDDSSNTNSPSENERGSVPPADGSDRDSGNVTLRSPESLAAVDGNSSSTNANNNPAGTTRYPNMHNELCDVCRNVLQRNRRNNTAVILRNNNLKQIKDELCEVVSEMEALDVPEDCKHSNKDKQMSIGRKKFNMDPKKGIEYLVENRLLRHDPQDVAHFLYKGEGLNKTAIGDYLGEKNEFNEDVLKAFVALHDFTNLILVQALRQFLWSFRLPGEAQKIDRMMETFAQRYCQLNPDIFTNTDTCYVLSFAIIMLNTSLHNPSVKDKPTVEQFISMNRGINNGGDLPRGLLESLYESIRTEPFKIPQDDGNDLMHTFFNPDKEGWLWKQGGRYKSWKRRWFILNDNCLYYFEYTTDKEPRGIIPLENISVREIHDRSKPHCFELFATGGADIIKACKTDSEGKVVEGKHTVYRMSAATEEDQQEWIKRLTQSISHNPFYDILVQRKKKALSKS